MAAEAVRTVAKGVYSGVISTATKVKDHFTGGSHDSYVQKEIRIVMIGKTGSGKSSTGNTIAGRKAFHSKASSKSITKTIHAENVTFENRKILIIDTPGLFDTQLSNEKIKVEIMKSVAIAAPGLHAVILVTKIGRFTQEEKNTIEEFKRYFGEGLGAYLIMVFTGKDDLEDNDTLEAYIEDGDPLLKELVLECKERYLAVNNKGGDKEKKTFKRNLLAMIAKTVEANDDHYYTNEMLDAAEEVMKKREAELQAILEEKHSQEKEKIIKEQQQLFQDKLKKMKQDFNEREEERNKEVTDAQSRYINSLKVIQGAEKKRTSLVLETERKKLEKQLEEEKRKQEGLKATVQEERLKQEQKYKLQLSNITKLVDKISIKKEDTERKKLEKQLEDETRKQEEMKAAAEKELLEQKQKYENLEKSVAELNMKQEQTVRALEVKKRDEDEEKIKNMELKTKLEEAERRVLENDEKIKIKMKTIEEEQTIAREAAIRQFEEEMQQEARKEARSEIENNESFFQKCSSAVKRVASRVSSVFRD